MTLNEFLEDFRAEIKAEVNDRINDAQQTFPFEESVFTEKMMTAMAEWGMTSKNPQVCYFDAPIANSRMKMNGYAISEDEENDRIDVFISIYSGKGEAKPISKQEISSSVNQCVRMIKQCCSGKIEKEIEPSDVVDFAIYLRETYDTLTEIRIFVLTDLIASSKKCTPIPHKEKTIYIEVMDIERYFRLGDNPIDDIIINFSESNGLPCLYVPKRDDDYACALTIFPAQLLKDIYEKYGARLLEGNVRSFLTAKRRVNKDIESTLINKPHRFMAYNNGLVLVVEKINIGNNPNGGVSITAMQGLQIVNGGQTTASMYFAQKKHPEIDLSKVRVPAKIIILNQQSEDSTEEMIAEISFCANSQNAVKVSDLSANRRFHRNVEQAFTRLYCPDGESKWFYERAAGSYAVKIAREASTEAQRKKLRLQIPPSQKITKTDLAKYIQAWESKPIEVAWGAQKNFAKFMETTVRSYEENHVPIDTEWAKKAIVKAIFFKAADRIVAKMKTASKITITTYLVAIFSLKYQTNFNFNKVWNNQALSSELQRLLAQWAEIVHNIIDESSGGRLMSEWAKNKACWEKVKAGTYPKPSGTIPELSL